MVYTFKIGDVTVNKKYKLEYYVLNEDFNVNEIEEFNIFSNVELYESTCNNLDDYYKNKITFKEFCEKLDKDVMWQEWSRAEYEIYVLKSRYSKGTPVEKLDFAKIDCYAQFHPNCEMVARNIIEINRPKKGN